MKETLPHHAPDFGMPERGVFGTLNRCAARQVIWLLAMNDNAAAPRS